MAVRSLGLVGIVNKGDYDPAATYVKGNFVYHMGSTWLCLYDNTSGIEPTEGGGNWKYLARGSGDMAYKTIELSPDDIVTSQTHAQFGYQYEIAWSGVKGTDFTVATIETDNYTSKFASETSANKVTLYFAKMPESTLGMYVFVQGGKVAEDGDDGIYTASEIDNIVGIGSKESTDTAKYAHEEDSYFSWKQNLAKATENISVGDTISESNAKTTDITTQLAIAIAQNSGYINEVKQYIKLNSSGNIVITAGIPIKIDGIIYLTKSATLTLESGVVGTDYYIHFSKSRDYEINTSKTDSNYDVVIGGFHYGIVRHVNAYWNPINTSGTEMGSGWETNVSEGIVPNSIWTLLHRPTCDPSGMVYIGPFWADIYESSDDGAQGLQSKHGVVPITGTEGLNWYIANERAMRVGKRLPSYAEWCKCSHGSPQGQDGNNTYAWSATTNTARTTCGNVRNAISAKNCRDCVGNVWEWVDELLHGPTAAAAGWYDPMPGYGQLYMYSETGLHSLICGGNWDHGVHAGSRAVSCSYYPWSVGSGVGVRCVCDSI